MNLLVGCPVKNRGWLLPDWFAAVEPQLKYLEETYHINTGTVFLYSESDDDTKYVIQQHTDLLLIDDNPGRSATNINGHVWGADDTYVYMSRLRNTLIEVALNLKADYFFSLDSDIILPESAIENLLGYAEHRTGVFSPAVNMTPRTTAWNTMSWVSPESPSLAHRPEGIELVCGKADVVMAAMLLDIHGMQAKWQTHKQGEDVGFCLDAWHKQIDRWWVPEIRCEHRMFQY